VSALIKKRLRTTLFVVCRACLLGVLFYTSFVRLSLYPDWNPGPFFPEGYSNAYIEKLEFKKEISDDFIIVTIGKAGNFSFNITGGYVAVEEVLVKRNLTQVSLTYAISANSEKIDLNLPADSLVKGKNYHVSLNTDWLDSKKIHYNAITGKVHLLPNVSP
jgi:hypothetical protein